MVTNLILFAGFYVAIESHIDVRQLLGVRRE